MMREFQRRQVAGEGRRPSSWVLGFASRLSIGCVKAGVVVVVGERDGAREDEEERQESVIQGF
jgi:hypothetical protein